MKKIVLLSGLLVLMASLPVYGESLLRIQCEDEDAGAEIYLNDKFAGECPMDASVREGTLLLRARKNVDATREKLFEKKLRVVDGVSQRVELVMSAPQLTADAKAKKQVTEAAALLKAAEGGDTDAMEKIAQRLDAGNGIKKDPAKARFWRNKAEVTSAQVELDAAISGDVQAMLKVAARYDAGLGVDQDPAQAREWRAKAEATKREKDALNRAHSSAKAKQAKLDQIKFSEYTEKMVNGSGVDNNNITAVFLTGIPSMILGLATDAVSAPTKSAEISTIKNQAALRPSTWGKPDSMVAKASRQQKNNHPAAEKPLVVAGR
jgi:hypothetical protein